VLPFENLSSDKENAFFAQGIQDEIITTLSRIGGLRVISRTSTAHYNSAPENLAEIARQLRVSHVLEGSVQKAGDRVHINVQLIQAETDAHLWAQSYDRQLTDIFNVEAEVAKSIADSLRTTLSPAGKSAGRSEADGKCGRICNLPAGARLPDAAR
jgi:TolB-like protein